MIRVLVLAAIFMTSGAVEETKATAEEIQSKVEDANSEPSVVSDKYFEVDARRVWDIRKSHEENRELTEEENKIVQDVYSPDYYEPNVILDFRYLKTGGRGYARSDGGQILILPKRDHMPAASNNYDTLLEYLRLQHLEEMERKWAKLKHEKGELGHGLETYYDDLH